MQEVMSGVCVQEVMLGVLFQEVMSQGSVCRK